MLILTRKIGAAVIIGGRVKIKILDAKNKEIAFGIEAPNEVSVHRQEIHEKIAKDQEQFFEQYLSRKRLKHRS